MGRLVNYVDFNSVNESIIKWDGVVNEKRKEVRNEVEDENWDELKNEILEDFKKLNPHEKRVILRKLEKDVDKS